jgi:glucose-1-phosphate cytidylyltransferase
LKTVILAGGLGTRVSEESHLRPKPMIEIGGQPILWHIMKIYSYHGYNDFVICAGYRQYQIKEYFSDYYLRTSDVTFDFTGDREVTYHGTSSEPWKVTIVDTGLNTKTGGRVKRIQPFIGNESFMLTYGDGLSDVNINKLVSYHFSHGKTATLTGVDVDQKFGVLDLNEKGLVTSFREKKENDSSVINGGFMVFEPEVFSLIKDDSSVLELDPLETLAKQGELMAFHHGGFWKNMDTQRDRDYLEELWTSGNARWKLW